MFFFFRCCVHFATKDSLCCSNKNNIEREEMEFFDWINSTIEKDAKMKFLDINYEKNI